MSRSFIAWYEVPKFVELAKKAIGLTFSLKTRKRHQLPLLDEKITSVLTGGANLLKLFTHKLPLTVAYTL